MTGGNGGDDETTDGRGADTGAGGGGCAVRAVAECKKNSRYVPATVDIFRVFIFLDLDILYIRTRYGSTILVSDDGDRNHIFHSRQEHNY